MIEVVKEGNINQTPSLKTADGKSVNAFVNEMNEVLINARTDNTSDTNKLIKTTAVCVTRKLSIEKLGKEPSCNKMIRESTKKLKKQYQKSYQKTISKIMNVKRGVKHSKEGKCHKP